MGMRINVNLRLNEHFDEEIIRILVIKHIKLNQIRLVIFRQPEYSNRSETRAY